MRNAYHEDTKEKNKTFNDLLALTINDFQLNAF